MHSDDRLTELPPPPASSPAESSPVTIRVVAFALCVDTLWPIVATSFLMAAGLVLPPPPPRPLKNYRP